MPALRALIRLVGKTGLGRAIDIVGTAAQEFRFDVDDFVLAKDSAQNPTWSSVALSATVKAAAAGFASLLESVSTLTGRMSAVEDLAAAGGGWDLSEIFVGSAGPETLSAVIGRYHRIDISGYGGGDVLTVTLPLVDASNVGRRIRIAEISGYAVGAPSGEIQIATSGGQQIDAGNVGPPYALAGTFPRATFVAIADAGPVYGWSLESAA